MAKDQASLISELMKKPEFIRNMGIVAHIDHGKTTLSDNLLAGAGMISDEHAGQQLAMDFVAQEQERGITIYSANVSMIHDYNGNDHLINMIDTPGHVDFGGDVTRAMRAVDGVIVVADAVEGVMPQTETVIRQALKERVKPILFINKTDRLIKELELTPEKMQERFVGIITEVNNLIDKYGEKGFKEDWYVKVENSSVAFGSATKNWAVSMSSMKSSGVTFKEVIDMTVAGQEKDLATKSPLHKVILDMVIKHLPNPLDAQKYRIKHLWPGDMDSKTGKSMIDCKPDGPLVGVVTKIYPDPHAGYVATVRIFSGKIQKGQALHLVGKDRTEKVQQVSVYKGAQRLNMDEVYAGNIVGIVGLKNAFSGETVCDNNNIVESFESITHMFEPVVTRAIEPKQPQQLSKLIEFLKRTSREDPTLRVKINEDTGEYLVSGLGELHINAKIEIPLKDEGLDVDISPPIVIYKESIKDKTNEAMEGKSPNKHNKFFVIAEKLEPKVYEAIVNGEIPEQEIKKKDVELQQKLVDLGMEREEVRKMKQIYNRSILLDTSSGVKAILEVMEMIKQSFREVMNEGPLAREPCAGIKIMLVDAKLHEDAIHRGPAQVIPATRFAMREAVKGAGAYILEPKQVIRIDVPTDFLSGATKEIQNRRGQILEMSEERGLSIIKTKIPVAEMFGFNSALKSSTGGQGFFWLIDVIYEPLPKELEPKVIKQIRERKGIKIEE